MSDIRIVVLQAGFVHIGVYSDKGDKIRIDHAHNVRRWGTEKGLGDLALNGQHEESILDFYGFVEAPVSALLFTIKCNPDKWEKFLGAD